MFRKKKAVAEKELHEVMKESCAAILALQAEIGDLRDDVYYLAKQVKKKQHIRLRIPVKLKLGKLKQE